jgi:hypothetical protein
LQAGYGDFCKQMQLGMAAFAFFNKSSSEKPLYTTTTSRLKGASLLGIRARKPLQILVVSKFNRKD